MVVEWQSDSGGWYDALAYTEPCLLTVKRLPDLEYADEASGADVVEQMWMWDADDPRSPLTELGYRTRYESGVEDSLWAAKLAAARVARRWHWGGLPAAVVDIGRNKERAARLVRAGARRNECIR